MQISKNFNLWEFEKSETAVKYGIDNRVNSDIVLNNLTLLVWNVLQPLRDAVNKPIHIGSGYRCPKVNALVGGVPTSQHMKGQACDIKITGMTPYEIGRTVLELGIPFDQLILYPTFVHVSYNKDNNRNKLLYNKTYNGRRDIRDVH